MLPGWFVEADWIPVPSPVRSHSASWSVPGGRSCQISFSFFHLTPHEPLEALADMQGLSAEPLRTSRQGPWWSLQGLRCACPLRTSRQGPRLFLWGLRAAGSMSLLLPTTLSDASLDPVSGTLLFHWGALPTSRAPGVWIPGGVHLNLQCIITYCFVLSYFSVSCREQYNNEDTDEVAALFNQ